MNKLFIIVAMLVGLASTGACKDYEAPTTTKVKPVYTDTVTGDRYIINHVAYPVYRTRNGAFYIWKDNKKRYLPKVVQKNMGRIYKEKNNEK